MSAISEREHGDRVKADFEKLVEMIQDDPVAFLPLMHKILYSYHHALAKVNFQNQ